LSYKVFLEKRRDESSSFFWRRGKSAREEQKKLKKNRRSSPLVKKTKNSFDSFLFLLLLFSSFLFFSSAMPSAPPPRQTASTSDSASRNRPNFTGYWRVVKVEGLDAFLKVKKGTRRGEGERCAIDSNLMPFLPFLWLSAPLGGLCFRSLEHSLPIFVHLWTRP